MTIMRRAAAILVAALALWVTAATAQLGGVYLGLDAARGMKLEIAERGQGFAGALTEAGGARRAFVADRLGDSAEGRATLGSGDVLLRIAPAAIGAQVVVIPFTEAGALDVSRTASLAFVREGVAMPDQPGRFLPAPTGPVRAFEPRAFVDSYPFWEPQGAAWAYEALEPRHRTVIRLFPLVQTDLLWKLCQGASASAAVAEALRGQGVLCGEVVDAIRAAQAGAGFDRFKRDVAAERAILLQTLACADSLMQRSPACEKAGRETARRAVSMETAATVLRRYR